MKKSLQFVIGMAGTMGLSSIYVHWVEPYLIETSHISIVLPNLPKAFEGFRICHFSDLHLGFYMEPEKLASVVKRIKKSSPDLICFTGDLFDHEPVEISKTIDYLAQLEAPFGKNAVLGNHDNWGNRRSVHKVLQKAGFSVLHNFHKVIRKQSDDLYIAGVDDPWVGDGNIQQAMKGIPKDACTILLAHEPDFADEFSFYPIDLQLSGHSHGGQVRLPLIGALYTPPHSHKYSSGLYQVNSKLQVYTTRGLGITRYPIRLNCRPEITMITLKSV
ncbi:metallophosphoesterase [Shimazuella kribbensis]|uniref:metallophosphoesterase n=1 Tax=Shimazuella kribbensis TaxID=139808 RepID=UPI001471FAC5|nr:metallophosphoesterase [Shimazuella kribbensis]